MNAILQDAPLPARLVPWPAALSTTLGRCVLLALLLHVWLLLLLGNAPGGSAAPGQGVWGAINVTLRGPATEGSAEPQPPPANPVAGPSATPRWGGAVRSAEEAPLPDQPGAAREGATLPTLQAPQSPARSEALAPAAPLPAVPSSALPSVPAPPLLQPAAPVPVPVQEEAPPAPAAPAPTSTPAPESRLSAVPLPASPAAVPALPRAPVLAPAPLPAATLPDRLPEPTAVIAAPRVERQVASPLQQPTTAPAPALPMAAPASAVAVPDLPTPPPLADAPAPLRRLQAAPVPAARTPEPALSPSAAPQAVALPPALATVTPAVPGTAVAAPGAPDAGAQLGRDVATPPGPAASAPLRLNLQLARPRGGETSRQTSMGALPVLPRPPERDEKLAKEIEKAGKTDCTKAYAGMGPLAVIPLAIDAVRKDGGCKW